MKKLLLTTLFYIVLGALSFAQTVQKTYYFDNPTVTEANGYDVIKFTSTMNNGVVGEASLPWQSVSLLLPQNTDAQSINVEYSDFVELEGTYNLLPRQAARPLSSTKPMVFAKKEELRDYVLKSFGLQPNDYNENFLKVKLVDTDLSVRALNCLKWLDITTLGDLIKRSPNDLWAIRNFGRKTMNEINNLLDEYGLKLASEALKDKAKRPIKLV